MPTALLCAKNSGSSTSSSPRLLIIIVADYIGTAVKAGTSHVVSGYGHAFFFVPQALVVCT